MALSDMAKEQSAEMGLPFPDSRLHATQKNDSKSTA
jgi:hypothetical protein